MKPNLLQTSLGPLWSWMAFSTLAVFFLLAFIVSLSERKVAPQSEEEGDFPSDWFYRQRAYPQGFIDHRLRMAAFEQALHMRQELQNKMAKAASQGPVWQNRGPSNIGGRITAMAISRQRPDIFYVGAADGGVLKSTNGGNSWTPLFDDQPSLSIGAVAVDPLNDNIVYVGTGEANSSGDSYDGFGMMKSTNGGATWFSLGLAETRHIGKIIIDPVNSNVIYVAAMGTLFSGNTERGVFKSTDGGATWKKMLFIDDSTGVVDLDINPRNSNILLAAAWQRMRGPQGRLFVGGVGTGIYRTTDAGATWTLLAGGLPSPSSTVGRPGVAIAPSNPSVAYVCYANDPGYFSGVYRTSDGGNSWTKTNDAALSSIYFNFGWYFGVVSVHPTQENTVYVLGVPLAISRSGGASWNIVYPYHVDQHAITFHPGDPSKVYIGNDGGFEISQDGGANWTRAPSLDLYITQFYAGCINPLNPNSIMGGTQDNGTVRTQTGSSADWEMVIGGDGFYSVIDYADTNFQYAEYQYGGIVRTTDNWRANVFSATAGIDPADRKNWSTPIVIDPKNPTVLYTGTQRLYRSRDRAVSWNPIGPDLTNGPVPRFGAYATITTIDVAPTDTNTIMVGTDDGNVWVTTDGGKSWTHVSAGLPNRWITRVRFDPADRTVAYVTLSGYRLDSNLPHIFRTADLGGTWQDVSGNLPEAPINVVLVDPAHRSRLYVGTDVGPYYSTDAGGVWQPMGTGLPSSSINDMQLHHLTRVVRAYTHGRSVWELRLDDLTAAAVEEEEPVLLPFELAQNYPNPFNPSTALEFRLGAEATVHLAIFDVRGQKIREFLRERLAPGVHTVVWDGKSETGNEVSSGVYFCQARAGSSVQTRRMALVR